MAGGIADGFKITQSQFTEAGTGDSPGLIASCPRPGRLVPGGTADPDPGTGKLCPQAAEAILACCIALEPRLRTEPREIIGHRVGLRPMRHEVRLEEQKGTSCARLIHNYGHGGAGVSLAWGCAGGVATLIEAPA